MVTPQAGPLHHQEYQWGAARTQHGFQTKQPQRLGCDDFAQALLSTMFFAIGTVSTFLFGLRYGPASPLLGLSYTPTQRELAKGCWTCGSGGYD